MNDIKIILWDLDGTILDFKVAQKNAIRSCFKKFGLGELSDEEVAEYDRINTKYWKLLELGKVTKPQVLEGRYVEFFEKLGIEFDIKTFVDEYQIRLGDTICFFPHAKEKLLEFKSRGIPQFAVTNGTTVAQKRKLARSGLDKIFDEIFISDQIGFEKPSPKFFEAVWAKAKEYISDIKKEEVLIIGDSDTSDMKMGLDAGIRTCFYMHQSDLEKDVKTDLKITDFSELVI